MMSGTEERTDGRRAAEAIRADLAEAMHARTDRWNVLASRLLRDVPSLLSECEQLRGSVNGADAANAQLRAELDAARRWQAKRAVAISQDPTCVKWMRESEQLALDCESYEAEIERLRAELAKRREQHNAEMDAAVARAWESARSETQRLLISQRDAYERELAAVRGVVQRVEALASKWEAASYRMSLVGGESPRPKGYSEGHYVARLKAYDDDAAELRAVLADPVGLPTEPPGEWIPCEHGVTHGGHDFAEDTEWGVNHHYCPGGKFIPTAVGLLTTDEPTKGATGHSVTMDAEGYVLIDGQRTNPPQQLSKLRWPGPTDDERPAKDGKR